MGLALAAFIVMAGTIVGAYAAVTMLPDRLARRRMDRRLRDVSFSFGGPAVEQQETVVKARAEGPLPNFDRRLAGSPLARLIEQAGAPTTASTILLGSIASALLLGFITSLTSRYTWAPALAAACGLVLPTLWLLRRRSTRMKRFEEQFPEALDLLSRAIRAGHAFQSAMGMVADGLPQPVGPEFRKGFEQQNFGLPLRDALIEMTERVPILDVKFFVTAVLIQRETGGNLSEILDNLASVVRERFKIRRQVRVHTAHGRFTGYVLLSLPAGLCIALMMINPDLMQLLFQERMGRIMLTGAMVLQTIGFIWIRHVIRIEV